MPGSKARYVWTIPPRKRSIFECRDATGNPIVGTDRGIVFLDGAYRIAVGREKFQFVRQSGRQVLRTAEPFHRCLEVLPGVPPDFHVAVIAGMDHLARERVLFR